MSAVEGLPAAAGFAAAVGAAPPAALARAAARMSAVEGLPAAAGFAAGFSAPASFGAAGALAAGAAFCSFDSAGFGSGFGTIFRQAGSMSYQPVLLNWSNSTRQRPFMLTVLTIPVVREKRANSGAGELTTTYLSVHSDLRRSMTSNMKGSRLLRGSPQAPTRLPADSREAASSGGDGNGAAVGIRSRRPTGSHLSNVTDRPSGFKPSPGA